LSGDQRREGLAALERVDGGRDGAEAKAASEAAAAGAAAKAPKQRRPDALGTSGHERVVNRSGFAGGRFI
jgi:hypothetical protein